MLVFFFRQLSKIPLPVLHVGGAILGWIVWLSSVSYRRRLRDNITAAGHAKVYRQAITEAGKSLLELPFIWCAKQTRVLRTAEVEDWQLFDAALARGEGLIMLTPHLGCFELIAQVIAQRLPFTVLYRPPRKDMLKPLIEGARARANLILAPANLSGVRTLLKTLKKGGTIGLLPDQVPLNGEGIWADFFGRPAYSMTMPAKMHEMSGAPVLLVYAERKPYGRGYLIRFVPFSEPLEGSAQAQTTAINRAMEQVIARCPEQYFWSYNRYKIPAGVNAPASSSGASA